MAAGLQDPVGGLGAAGLDRLAMAIVQEGDASGLSQELKERTFRYTRLSTIGGFLRRPNTVFLIGYPRGRSAELMRVLTVNCRTRLEPMAMPLVPEGAAISLIALAEPIPEVPVGGATVFEFEVERFERL